MTNMGLRSIHGTYLKDEWKSSANTYLGPTIVSSIYLFFRLTLSMEHSRHEITNCRVSLERKL